MFSLGNLIPAHVLHTINQDSKLYIAELGKDQNQALARERWKCSHILQELSKFSVENRPTNNKASILKLFNNDCEMG